MNRRRAVVLAALVSLLAAPAPATAQTRKLKRVGVILPGAPGRPPPLAAALRELGWVDGSTVAFEWRWCAQPDAYAPAASDLAAIGVDVIVTVGVTITNVARRATSTIPIVFIGAADPVKFGLVASLARPGANVTGIAIPPLDWGKYLELAHEIVPSARRIALIANPRNETYADYIAQNEAAAARLGMTLQVIPVGRGEELPGALREMQRESPGVLVFGPDPLYFANVRQIVELARAAGVPVIAPFLSAPALGAVAAYGSDLDDSARRGAAYVDRILKGAQPGELPVQQPDQFKLILNLKAAEALNVSIPRSLQLRASEIVE